MWINTLRNRWYGRSRPLPCSLRRQSTQQRPSFRPRLEALEDRTLLTAYSAATIGDLVTDIGLANQNGGSNTITLAAATGSTYTLTAALPTIAYTGSGTGSDKLTIIGNGDKIDGNNQYRLFDVAGGNSLTLKNLTLQHGLAKGSGTAAEGGAIYSSGRLLLSHVKVTDNQAVGSSGSNGGNGVSGSGGHGGNGDSASGGGLYVAGGAVTLANDTFSNNTAQGGVGGHGGSGGGIGSQAGHGGGGGDGGSASGGGLAVAAGTVTLRNDTFGGNHALGGVGGGGGAGGKARTSRFGVTYTGHGGHGGGGGIGYGGGLFALLGTTTVTVTLANDLLNNNHAQGGAGGVGGVGGTGGNGGIGGSGQGGGLYYGIASGSGTYVPTSSLHLINDTAIDNLAFSGIGGLGLDGSGRAASNNGVGGGMDIMGPNVGLANTLIANNNASGGTPDGPDVAGTVTTSDCDLVANPTGSSGFGQTGSGDILNVAADVLSNGTLLAGSPAIDAGDSTVAPGAVDRLGYARIVGNAIDIGAFEYGATNATTDLSVAGKAAYGTPASGEIIYRLAVKNNSSTAQSNVTLTDVLPADTTLVSWTAASGWSYSTAAAGNSGGSVSAWIASLAADTTATFTLVVEVNSGTATGTIVTNTAAVGPITGDPKPGNNSITFRTTVNAGVDVSADVRGVRDRITTNSTLGVFEQSVTITNTSSSPLSGPLALQLTQLPVDVTLANASGYNSPFTASGLSSAGAPFIDFLAPGHSLAPGQSITFTLEFTAPAATSIKGYDAEVMQGW